MLESKICQKKQLHEPRNGHTAERARGLARMEIISFLPLGTMMRNKTHKMPLRYDVPAYPNVTIEGHGVRAVVYIPDADKGYYRSSRFDWGSMVGRVQLAVPNNGGNVTLFTDARPRPHRPLLSDHVLGLAAEFGCGVRGTLCTPGHGYDLLATNGVLGYGDAGKGGTFLKLGVGKLQRPCVPCPHAFFSLSHACVRRVADTALLRCAAG